VEPRKNRPYWALMVGRRRVRFFEAPGAAGTVRTMAPTVPVQ